MISSALAKINASTYSNPYPNPMVNIRLQHDLVLASRLLTNACNLTLIVYEKIVQKFL